MQVRILIGATAAYACIKTPTKSLDVQLSPGRSASKSLKETAAEWRAQADRLNANAALAEGAAIAMAGTPRGALAGQSGRRFVALFATPTESLEALIAEDARRCGDRIRVEVRAMAVDQCEAYGQAHEVMRLIGLIADQGDDYLRSLRAV